MISSEKEVSSMNMLQGKGKSIWIIVRIFIFSWVISGAGIFLLSFFRVFMDLKMSLTAILLLPATLVLGPIFLFGSDYRQERLDSVIWLYWSVLIFAVVLTAIGLILHKKRLGRIAATSGFLVWFFLGYFTFFGCHG